MSSALDVRRRFVVEGSTNPLSADDWAASLVAEEARDVLDLSPGDGGLARSLVARRGDSIRRLVVACPDDASLARLGELPPRAEPVKLDPDAPAGLAESFDGLLVRDLLHRSPAPERTLETLLGTLRRGGAAVLVTPHRDDLAELWTLVRTFDPAFPAVAGETSAFDSESAPEVLDRLDRPWQAFPYENVLEATPASAAAYVESWFGEMRITRPADWSGRLRDFLASWSGEFFWAVSRRAAFVVA